MPSAPTDLGRFLSDLSERRARLLDLVQTEDHERAALAAELNELSEQLIVAEEELRVQQEELDAARQQLSSLAAEQELLVGAVPQALVVTDERGTVQRTTRAADRLALRKVGRTRPHPIAMWFDVPDRPAIRSMITHRRSGLVRPQRARLRRADGTTRPVLVTLNVGERPHGGGELLHWQLVDLVHEEVGDAGGQMPAVGLGPALADLAVRLEQAATGEELVAEAVAEVVRLVPEVEQAEIVLVASEDAAASRGPLRVAGGNVLVVPLPSLARVRGELVLFAKAASSFSEAAEPVATLVAGHAAAALARRIVEDDLRRAVESGRQVGRAVGILMERHRLDEEAAFARLVQASQAGHVKLREVARRLVETGLEPDGPRTR